MNATPASDLRLRLNSTLNPWRVPFLGPQSDKGRSSTSAWTAAEMFGVKHCHDDDDVDIATRFMYFVDLATQDAAIGHSEL